MPYKYSPEPGEQYLLDMMDEDPELAEETMRNNPAFKEKMQAALFGRRAGLQIEALPFNTTDPSTSTETPSRPSDGQ